MPQENLVALDENLTSRLWQELKRAPHDRHHDWRTPTLATEGMDQSGPQARTVVLRHADAASWTLRVYTDARSPKCSELVRQPLAQLSFWSKRLNWQLRVSARATVEFEGEHVDAAWEQVKHSRAAADYTGDMPPGYIQSSSELFVAHSGDSRFEHHLAILNFKVSAMDWLELNRDGHRRARLTPDGGLMRLVP